MKKRIIIYFTILLLCGCTIREKEELLDSTTSEEISESSIETETNSELNHDEILVGNFSSIVANMSIWKESPIQQKSASVMVRLIRCP